MRERRNSGTKERRKGNERHQKMENMEKIIAYNLLHETE
jgi:hypothetical protein